MAYRRGLLNRARPQRRFLEDMKKKKFVAPEHELDQEKFLRDLQPRSHVAKAELRNFIIPRMEDAPSEAERNAWAFWYSQLELDDKKAMIDAEMIIRFNSWLLGKGEPEDHEKTPWYRQPVQDDEVLSYLASWVDAKYDFLAKLQLLVAKGMGLGLQGVNEYWMFYKYIVRGGWEDTDRADFLHDWNRYLADAGAVQARAPGLSGNFDPEGDGAERGVRPDTGNRENFLQQIASLADLLRDAAQQFPEARRAELEEKGETQQEQDTRRMNAEVTDAEKPEPAATYAPNQGTSVTETEEVVPPVAEEERPAQKEKKRPVKEEPGPPPPLVEEEQPDTGETPRAKEIPEPEELASTLRETSMKLEKQRSETRRLQKLIREGRDRWATLLKHYEGEFTPEEREGFHAAWRSDKSMAHTMEAFLHRIQRGREDDAANMAALQERLRHVQTKHEENAATYAEMLAASAAGAQFNSDLAKVHAKQERLLIEALRSQQAELGLSDEDFGQLEEAILANDADYEGLQRKLEEAQAKKTRERQEVEEMKTETIALQADMQQLQQTLAKKEKLLSTAQEEKARAEKIAGERAEHIAELQAQLGTNIAQTEKVQQLLKEVQRLQGALSSAEKGLETETKMRKERTQELEETQKKLAKALEESESEKAQKGGVKEALQAARTHAADRIRELQNQIDGLRSALAESAEAEERGKKGRSRLQALVGSTHAEAKDLLARLTAERADLEGSFDMLAEFVSRWATLEEAERPGAKEKILEVLARQVRASAEETGKTARVEHVQRLLQGVQKAGPSPAVEALPALLGQIDELGNMIDRDPAAFGTQGIQLRRALWEIGHFGQTKLKTNEAMARRIEIPRDFRPRRAPRSSRAFQDTEAHLLTAAIRKNQYWMDAIQAELRSRPSEYDLYDAVNEGVDANAPPTDRERLKDHMFERLLRALLTDTPPRHVESHDFHHSPWLQGRALLEHNFQKALAMELEGASITEGKIDVSSLRKIEGLGELLGLLRDPQLTTFTKAQREAKRRAKSSSAFGTVWKLLRSHERRYQSSREAHEQDPSVTIFESNWLMSEKNVVYEAALRRAFALFFTALK